MLNRHLSGTTIVLGGALLLQLAGAADACTNLLVTKGASEDGSVIITYTCDGEFHPTLRYTPAATYEPGAVIYHRNERTLSGLFREGYVHGFHAPRIHKKHCDLLEPLERPRFNLGSGRVAVKGLLHYLGGRDRPLSIYRATFNLGKQLGKLAGSVRWGYAEL